MRKYLDTYTLGAEGASEASHGIPVELRDVTMFLPSPSGKCGCDWRLALMASQKGQKVDRTGKSWGQSRHARLDALV